MTTAIYSFNNIWQVGNNKQVQEILKNIGFQQIFFHLHIHRQDLSFASALTTSDYCHNEMVNVYKKVIFPCFIMLKTVYNSAKLDLQVLENKTKQKQKSYLIDVIFYL